MDLKKIGKFIACSRKKKKMTQEQLAEELGINNRTISRWENGKNLPDASLYKPLCNILDISIEELINGEKTEKREFKDSVEKAIISTINLNESNKKKTNVLAKAIIVSIIIIVLLCLFFTIYIIKKYPNIDIYGITIIENNNSYLKKILNNDELNLKIWFYGIDSLQLIDKDNVYYDFKSALKHKQSSINDVKKYLDFQVQNGSVESFTLRDGGTKIYKTSTYEVIFCNTIDGNKDIYFGNKNMTNKLNGKYCSHTGNNTCYFTRTFHVTKIVETKQKDFFEVTLYNDKKDLISVYINNSYDIKPGKNYNFTFSTYKKFPDNIENIFKNSTLINVIENEKNDIINEEICVNE